MKYATFDIETRNWIDFEVMGFYDGEDYHKYISIERFLDRISTPGYDGFSFYAHNGGKFDFLFILEPMIDRGWKLSLIPRGGSIICIEAETVNGTHIQFRDSYALLPLSLKKLCEAFHVKHPKGEIDYDKISKDDSETLRYLEKDCISLYECISTFFSSPYVVEPQLTIASQALDTYRRKFSSGRLQQMDPGAEGGFRSSYYAGGRVEVFKGYGLGLTEYDVNSLYPSAMLGEMPTGIAQRTQVEKKGYIGFYHVQVISSPVFDIPPFLVKVRTTKDNKNFYVNGPGEFYLSSDWVDYLRREHGVRFKILDGWYFPERRTLFEDYVRTFYELKQKAGGTPEYTIAKFMLNTFYGKLGMNRARKSIVTYNDDLGQSFETFDDSLGIVTVDTASKSKWVLPYLAAYITDRARLHHFKLLQQHEGEVYYCDTDSIITTASYQVGSGIGELSEKGKHEEGVFINSKCYALKNSHGESVKFKGFDVSEKSNQERIKKGEEPLDFKTMLTHLRQRKNLCEKGTRILSFGECTQVRNGKEVVRKKGLISVRGKFLRLVETSKEAVISYDKRLTIPSKKHIFTTRPFTYSELIKAKSTEVTKPCAKDQLQLFFASRSSQLSL